VNLLRIALAGLAIWGAIASATALVLCRIAHNLKRRHRRERR
jgi:hypothetical protein